MVDHRLRVLHVLPNHPKPGEASSIRMAIELSYLQARPIVQVPITKFEAIVLIEQLAKALRYT